MKQKTINILYWVFTILFCAFMTYSGFSQALQVESAQKVMTDLGYPIYMNYILGVAKILGVIALLLPLRTLKEWAYAGFFFDIVGAGFSMFFNGQGFMALSVVPFLVVLFLSYRFWKKREKNKRMKA